MALEIIFYNNQILTIPGMQFFKCSSLGLKVTTALWWVWITRSSSPGWRSRCASQVHLSNGLRLNFLIEVFVSALMTLPWAYRKAPFSDFSFFPLRICCHLAFSETWYFLSLLCGQLSSYFPLKHNLACSVQPLFDCLIDIRGYIALNFLNFNENRTKVILFRSSGTDSAPASTFPIWPDTRNL